MTHSGLISQAFLALVLVSACSGLPFEPAGPEAAPDPAKPGPFAVGVRTVVIQDGNPDRVRPDGSPRRLTTEIWYPATEDARGKQGATYDLTELLTAEQKAQLGSTKLPPIVTTAVRDAAPNKAYGPYPMVLFSHGQAETRFQSTFFTEQLASHGFVVVAMDHPGHTLGDQARGAMDEQIVVLNDRPLDTELVLDTMLELDANDPLAGLIDAEHVGMAGHSFGALTTLRVAAVEKRIKAIAPMAPPSSAAAWIGLAGAGEKVTLRIPVMVLAGHEDTITTWDADTLPTWNSLQRPRWLVDFRTGGHFTFSGFCTYATLPIPVRVDDRSISDMLANGCVGDAPRADVAQRLVNHFAVGFFNATLRGSTKSGELLVQAKADGLAQGVVQVQAEP